MFAPPVPLQFAAAAGADLAGGYDSTAVSPRTGAFESAPLARVGIDALVNHASDRVVQQLRLRGEAQYVGAGDRTLADTDLFGIARYSLAWRPSEETLLTTDAAYAIGAPTLFFSRAGRPDVQFARSSLAYPRQRVADYSVREDLVREITPDDALQVEVVIAGRYRIDPAPRGQTIFNPNAGVRWTHRFDEDNTGSAGVRAEYFNLELFRPATSLEAYVGWGHYFDEDTVLSLEGGGLIVEQNVGADVWTPQPYGRARFFRRFPAAGMILGATYARTFGIVSSTTGTGPLDIVTAGLYWHSENGRWVVPADATFQHGDGNDPVTQQSLSNYLASAATGVRWNALKNVRFFATYEFQYETGDAYARSSTPNFVRHVALAGVQFAFGSDDDALAALVPIDEEQAIGEAHARDRIAGGQSLNADGTDFATGPFNRRGRVPGDPSYDELRLRERDRNAAHPPAPGDATVVPGGDNTPAPGDADQREPIDPLAPVAPEDER